jgi:crossover junction endodeoxyribonuclease RuvC
MRILGLDPGLNTGYCIIEKEDVIKIIDIGEIKSGVYNRFFDIYKGIKNIIEKYNPTIACVERCFMNINPKTSLLLSSLRGVLLLALEEKNVNYLEYHPTHMRKRIFGNGNIKKKDIKELLSVKFKCKLTHNTSDALLSALAVLDTKLSDINF